MTSSIIGITITHGADYLTGVNLGVVIGTDLPALKASELRSHIVKQVPSCPQQFNICTKQGNPQLSFRSSKDLDRPASMDVVDGRTPARDEKASISEWCDRDIKMVAGKISVRVQELTVAKLPSLVKRATVVKSCACLWLNNSSATLEDREGAPLVMICLHPEQHKFAMELKSLLVGCGLEVWCTTELDRGHMEHIDSLASSQEAINFSILNEAGHSLSGDHGNKDGRKGNHVLDDIRLFQEKADDASVRSQDEDFKDVLIQRVKSELDPVERMKRSYSRSFSSPFSPVEGSYSNRSPAVRSPAIRSPATRSPAPFIGTSSATTPDVSPVSSTTKDVNEQPEGRNKPTNY
ncbi:hypothetical protein MAR_015440 [Mya arenaria]|uniref:Uncharacterized protein n=1 Tax=Mya arenaria TaxID=6604 RepID=A0ABY7FKJ8_MYAAR|nr:hypothetical protein MAR_015440 [Mya arenaria]